MGVGAYLPRATPRDLADLETQLTQGVQAREAFCTQAIALVPPDPGTRTLLGDLVGAFVKPLVDAVITVYKLKAEEDRLLRFTFAGWAEPRSRPRTGRVDVLTPPTSVTALANGYTPVLHPTAAG